MLKIDFFACPNQSQPQTEFDTCHHLDAKFSRILFTPDLLPSNVTGTEVYIQAGGTSGVRFEPGPIFAKIVLADEINRAPAKV